MKKILTILALALGLGISAWAGPVPEYPGGKTALDKYIAENMKYPKPALDNGIEGVVGVTFTVNADGSIGNIKIKRMIDPDLEAEAVRLVKNMPAWTPADKDGKPVAAPAEVDVNFALPE